MKRTGAQVGKKSGEVTGLKSQLGPEASDGAHVTVSAQCCAAHPVEDAVSSAQKPPLIRA